MDVKERVNHPAKFSPPILHSLVMILDEERDHRGYPDDVSLTVLDPFAGIGGIHELQTVNIVTYGIELEPEWAFQHPWNRVGDALDLPYGDDYFDVVATSPCYGNRMADTYDGRDGSKRFTYTTALGHRVTEGSSAGMQWGNEYRKFHVRAWKEASRVLVPGGLLVVNISDHVRKGKVVPVALWHERVIQRVLGYRIERVITVHTPRMGMGQNRELRVDGEKIIVARKPQ